MSMTVKDLIKKYKERFNDSYITRHSEHRKFWEELTGLSGERCKNINPYPTDIDAATELNDQEAYAWLQRLVNLPDRPDRK